MQYNSIYLPNPNPTSPSIVYGGYLSISCKYSPLGNILKISENKNNEQEYFQGRSIYLQLTQTITRQTKFICNIHITKLNICAY